MKLGVLKERAEGERRVALVPEAVGRLVQAGHSVTVQAGAGQGASLQDKDFQAAGATVVGSAAQVIQEADVLFHVRAFDIRNTEELELLRPGMVLIAVYQPLVESTQYFETLTKRKVTVFSMDTIPRISRAQSMDVLSSMSTVAGYRAVVMAAEKLGKFFPLLMTAAGTIPPAKVFVLGAGVAGLQAIATAHRLGAVVQAFDTRPVVREQVESLGASFVTVDVEAEQTKEGYASALSDDAHNRELEALSRPVAESDVVITTALIPGKRAPILITKDMVASMRRGSVIVDLGAEAGGNCELSQPGQTIEAHEVTIMAPFNVPSQLPLHASQLYGRNVITFFNHALSQGLVVDRDTGETTLDLNDEIVRRTLLMHNGQIMNEALQKRIEAERG